LQAAKIEETVLNGDQVEGGPKKKNKKKNKKPAEQKTEGENIENGVSDKKVENGLSDKKTENGDSDKKVENGEPNEGGDNDESEKSKKKRNRPKKKKTEEANKVEASTNGVKVQTDPPSLPISELFTGTYPVGQEMEYPVGQDDLKAKNRFSSEEKRALDRSQLDMYNEIRQVKIKPFLKKITISFFILPLKCRRKSLNCCQLKTHSYRET